MIAAFVTDVVAALVFATWLYLALGRGGFWRGRENDRTMHGALKHRDPALPWPRVVAIIPARNEADLVATTVGSLLRQRYPGELSVVVVDDHSDDGTASVARRAAVDAGAGERLTVLSAPPLPNDWTGKLWALATGVAHVDARCDVTREPPEYLLFTDADIRYEPDAVAALVSSAVAERRVLSSLMVALRCESLAERALIPAFVFFFQMLYPFAWVTEPRRSTAAAAGGCVLVARRALAEAGGIAAIRGSLIDDCALARALKPRGPIALALGEHVHSLRPYPAFADIRRMVVRSAYAQLRFSPWLLIGVVLAMLFVFIAPVAIGLFATGWVQALGLASWASMGVLFMPMLKRYAVPVAWAFGLPLIAATYLSFTIESAWQHGRGRGGLWKGRVAGSVADAP